MMKKINIQNPFSDAPVYYRDVTGSTMDDCKKDSSNEILHGTVYQAGFQTSGRGRISGRNWSSEAGLNLTFSLVLNRSELEHELNHMPLIAGIALTRAVCEYTGRDFKLKWPNDLIFENLKTAGILCEADSKYFYCGMGINCNQMFFSGELNKKATSLKKITGIDIDHSRLLRLILKYFKQYLKSEQLWRAHLEESLYKKGEFVEVQQGRADSATAVIGKILGIGNDGQLLLKQLNGSVSEIYAGEIEL